MSLDTEDVSDYIPYFSEGVFERYLLLVEEAIEEDNLDDLERFWNAAVTMGTYGRIIQVLINEGSNRIVQRLRRDEGKLPFYFISHRGPHNFRLLMRQYNGYRLEEAVKKGDQMRIGELLALGEDLLVFDDREVIRLATKEKNFSLLEYLMKVDVKNAEFIYNFFDSIYETYHTYRAQPLTEEELIRFLVVLAHATQLIPGYTKWPYEFVIILYRSASGSIVSNVDGTRLLGKYVGLLSKKDKEWLRLLMEQPRLREEMNEYLETLINLL